MSAWFDCGSELNDIKDGVLLGVYYQRSQAYDCV